MCGRIHNTLFINITSRCLYCEHIYIIDVINKIKKSQSSCIKNIFSIVSLKRLYRRYLQLNNVQNNEPETKNITSSMSRRNIFCIFLTYFWLMEEFQFCSNNMSHL